MSDKKVRLIDANALMQRICGKECGQHFKECDLEEDNPDTRCVFREYVQSEPAVEAITREQYHDMTERFFDEFVDNGANEETIAKLMFIGLAFGKLELMLFGENEDGDSE